MENIIQDFQNLLSVASALAMINIIVIDIVMSGDNAIVIGMATRNLPPVLRKKAIFIGIALATVMRIGFAFFATYLLTVTGLRFAGGILLLYVVWKFYKELRNGGNHHENETGLKAGATAGLAAAVYTIIIADFSMSLDNVLAVAGAANENVVALGIGLIFSIMLMAFASGYIAKKLNDFPIIQWVGLLVILFVAIEMLIKGTPDIENTIHIHNLFPFFIFMASLFFILLHQKYMKPINQDKIRDIIDRNYLKIIIGFLGSIFLFVNLGETISGFIVNNEAIKYFINLIVLFIFLEVVNVFKVKTK